MRANATILCGVTIGRYALLVRVQLCSGRFSISPLSSEILHGGLAGLSLRQTPARACFSNPEFLNEVPTVSSSVSRSWNRLNHDRRIFVMNNSPVTIPFLDLNSQFESICNDIVDAVDRVLVSGQFVGGEWVELFEEQFARFVGSRYAISVSSGTAGPGTRVENGAN